MAEAPVETVKISKGHLECPICCCLFKDPKLLDCLHSFCRGCLEDMMSKKKPGAEKIPCPVCRRETQVPEGGLKSLSSAFFLSSLVDEIRYPEEVLGEASLFSATCGCGEGMEATWRCVDCRDNLCPDCWKSHRRFTKDHQIISLEDGHKSKIPPAEHSKPITRMCMTHNDHPLCLYCEKCDVLICSLCVVEDHRSAEHKILKIDDCISSFRSEVDSIVQRFEKSRQLYKSTANSIKRARNRLQKKVAQARRDISEKAEAEIAKIRDKAKRLTKKLEEIGQERDSEYERALVCNRNQMKRADQIVTAVNDLMRRADDFELMGYKPKVMHNLEFQKELKFEPAKDGPSFIGVRCQDIVSDADLGEVCVCEKWQLKEEFCKAGTADKGLYGTTDVACFRNGDIAVVDWYSKRLSLFSSTGRYKTSVAQGDDRHQLEVPRHVAVTDDDLLFVTDKKKVKVFNDELQFVREFTPSADDAEGLSESDLRGIAVDKQRVAVADWGRKVISVHKLDESLISSISKDMVGGYLAFSNEDRLIFTNWREERLLCVDFKGNDVFNVMTLLDGEPARPTVVLCDDDGNIYVGVWSGEFGKAEVHRYDSNGASVATVVQGLLCAYGMAFTPAGDVAVADRHSVKIFERI